LKERSIENKNKIIIKKDIAIFFRRENGTISNIDIEKESEKTIK